MSEHCNRQARPKPQNILLLNNDGQPLACLPKKRATWYVNKKLVRLIDNTEKYSEYDSVIQLLNPASSNDVREFDYRIEEYKCVVCGGEQNLTKHHVLPHCIRKYYPDRMKSKNKSWCVYLCDEHHDQADKLALEIHNVFLIKANDFIKHLRDITMFVLTKLFIYSNGGYDKLAKKYKDKFMRLNPKHLKDGYFHD